ncbi:hypothetical protein HPP92_021093 [Vanilla planifolia]|uniref:Uncharacterized protein n=1 Tax=Vanilla planifolia TaxID=51239 RepID=A0A835Q449_VANPL|nr:hypothetical protein HPP92_021093 [Vanilla planifolia]
MDGALITLQQCHEEDLKKLRLKKITWETTLTCLLIENEEMLDNLQLYNWAKGFETAKTQLKKV